MQVMEESQINDKPLKKKVWSEIIGEEASQIKDQLSLTSVHTLAVLLLHHSIADAVAAFNLFIGIKITLY